MKLSFSASIIDVEGEVQDVSIKPLRTLGKGRAAVAELVEVEGLHGGKVKCVEKVFRPGLLTCFIYWWFFQSPFPYRMSKDAILACLYRRKVASCIISLAGVDIGIASPFYVRWDERACAFVLGSEFIEGVSLQVDAADARVMRRFLRNYIVRPLKKMFGVSVVKEPGPASEASYLVARMKEAEKVFRKSGLVGSGWQVSTLALVATANFIKRGERYILVDIESGIPSILVPYYFFLSLVRGRFPFFDDMDEKKLNAYLSENEEQLREKLGPDISKECMEDSKRLAEHTGRWKAGEIAIFRNHLKLFLPGVRASVKRARMDVWLRESILDETGRERFAGSRRFFTSGIFMAGIFPGKLGKLLRKLIGNHRFRNEFKKFFREKEYRREAIRQYLVSHTDRWRDEERILPGRSFQALWGKFTLHLFLGRLTPRGLHRFFADGARRKKVAATALLFVISEKFQTEYAKYVIFRRMREWVDDGRLSSDEADLMKARVEDGSMQEYVRVFGLHFALKFLEAVTSAIKLVGIGWFLRIFVAKYPELNPQGELTLGLLKAFVGTFLHNPIPILMMINTSVWRTMITLWRMLSIKRRHISYKVALIVGVIPAFGSLAYPMQMYWRCKELSVFLIRDILAVLAQKIPIYGGKHTLVEVGFVRWANIPAEIMELMKSSIASIKSVVRRRKPVKVEDKPATSTEDAFTAGQGAAPFEANPGGQAAAASSVPVCNKRAGRFDKLVDEMIERIWDKYEREYAGRES